MKVFFKFAIFILSLFTLAGMVRGAIVSGVTNNTTIFLLGITVLLWVYLYFFDRLIKIKWLNIFIFAFCSAVFLWAVFLWGYGRRMTATFEEPVVIVLGAGTRDGEALGALRARLDAAVSFHGQNPGAYIIVSGGTGHRMATSEAYIMARYLREAGVPEGLIILEDNAYSTHSNMGYSQIILAEMFEEMPTVAIITNNFHMYRSVRFARNIGIETTMYPAPTPTSAAPLAYAREIASIIKMWLIGR